MMKVAVPGALLICLLSSVAAADGLIVFDRGANLSDLGPQIALVTPSALFTIDPGQNMPLPVLVPGTRDGTTNVMGSWFPDRQRVVYVSNRSSEALAQIWVVNRTTQEQVQLTSNQGNNLWPVVSPDGLSIAFVSTGDIGDTSPPDSLAVQLPNNLDLYVMAADGSNVRRLTQDSLADEMPMFSFDGRTIYYVSVGVTPAIRSIPITGNIGDDTAILGTDNLPIHGTDVSLTGDSFGDTLYFNSNLGLFTTYDIFARTMTIGPNTFEHPFLSQDGTHVVYTTGRNLYTATLQGGSVQTLLLTGDVGFARWQSPGNVAVSGTIHVLAPNGGETWPRGTTRAIKWEGNAKSGKTDDSVTIQLSHQGFTPVTIVASTPNNGEYDWPIPVDQDLGSDFIVTVSFVADPAIFDNSDAPFSIVTPQSCPKPSTPQGLVASRGQFGDGVHLQWNPVSGAVEYRVYRNRLNSWYTSTLIDTVPDAAYIDTSAQAVTTENGCNGPQDVPTVYYYFIRASGDCGLSDFSASYAGYRGRIDTTAQAAGDIMLLAITAATLLALGRRLRHGRTRT